MFAVLEYLFEVQLENEVFRGSLEALTNQQQ